MLFLLIIREGINNKLIFSCKIMLEKVKKNKNMKNKILAIKYIFKHTFVMFKTVNIFIIQIFIFIKNY